MDGSKIAWNMEPGLCPKSTDTLTSFPSILLVGEALQACRPVVDQPYHWRCHRHWRLVRLASALALGLTNVVVVSIQPTIIVHFLCDKDGPVATNNRRNSEIGVFRSSNIFLLFFLFRSHIMQRPAHEVYK